MGTDKISSSLQTGQLVQSLIADLSSPDTSKIRQEIALVALDQTLWDQNQELVLQICERIIRNADQYDQITGTLAFEILETRNPARAQLIKEEITNAFTTKVAVPTLSGTDSSKVIQATTYQVSENPKLLTRVKKNSVYLHFANEKDRVKIRSLQKDLIESGFSVPGIQRVDGNYKIDIRFFHPEDLVLVGSIEQIIKDHLRTEGITIEKIPVKNFSKTTLQNKTPLGLIEVWINFDRLK
jgi:hypothetical protein